MGEAFNLLNHKIITSVNTTHSLYTAATRNLDHVQQQWRGSNRLRGAGLHLALHGNRHQRIRRGQLHKQRPVWPAPAAAVWQVLLLTFADQP